MVLQVYHPHQPQVRLTIRAGLSGLAEVGGFCLLLWGALLIGSMDVAGAEMSSGAFDPELPPPSTLKPGKILRGPEGAPILVAPNIPSGVDSVPVTPLEAQGGAAETAAEPTIDGASPPASPRAANDEAPALPPPAYNKAVTPRRLPGGELAAVPRTPRTLKICPPQAAKPDCNYLS